MNGWFPTLASGHQGKSCHQGQCNVFQSCSFMIVSSLFEYLFHHCFIFLPRSSMLLTLWKAHKDFHST